MSFCDDSPVLPGHPPNFDRLARPYRWLEYLSFGPFLQRTRNHFLPQIAHRRHALVLGDGDGRFTARLLRANPEIQVHAVDLSAAMLIELQKSSTSHHHRLTVEQADLRTWRPSNLEAYDLVVTHFVLDCLTASEISTLASRLALSITPDALWLVSEFAIPQHRYGRAVARSLVSFLYRVFRFLTGLQIRSLPDYAEILTSAGFQLNAGHSRLGGLLVSQLWSYPEGEKCIPIGTAVVSTKRGACS